MADVTDYTGLVTSEHADKPKFMAMVGGVAQAFVDIQNQLSATPPSFDLDSAVGVQLDAVGLWVGITRNVNTPLTGVYFSLDTSGLGFDQGVWQGPFDPTTGVVSLDDDTYRLLIRAKIGANSWDGTLGTSAAILNRIFDGGTYVFIQDNGDMSITYGIAGNVPSAIFLALLRGGYIPLKPEAVHINGYFVTSNSGSPLFGFDVENDLISGFDVGAWGVAA
ncbi:DUF2612 domain-containing protein [Caballeronia sp. NCTM5]|uniref:DUF2612 domain-containing protein n=1 Tax=Caballeronia sp. NCTM5 TaxID=2921755 RepID=UPI002027A042|nr:DUF2612 domain-containing protein [Caballeronia sp. NCTM5]